MAANKFLISIPPFFSWESARAAVGQALQKLSDYILALPPKTEFSNQTLSGVADPVNRQDAATKNYVDTTVAGLGGGNQDLSSYIRGATRLKDVNVIPKIFTPGVLTESSLQDDATRVYFSEPFLGTSTSTAESHIRLLNGSNGAVNLFVLDSHSSGLDFDIDFVGGTNVAKGTSVVSIYKDGASLSFYTGTGNTIGGTASYSKKGSLDLASGNWRFGDSASPSYSVDASGDVNTAGGVFRFAGTGGVTNTIALAKLTVSGTNGSLTFKGGICTQVIFPS